MYLLLHFKVDVKAHDKEVVGMALACVNEDPEQPKLLLYTAGVDSSSSLGQGIEHA